MEDKEEIANQKTIINLHEHGYETGEYDMANLTPHQFLSVHSMLSEKFDSKIFTNCGSHDSTIWAKKVWELYKTYPELSKKVEIIPQSEFTVDTGRILTYYDKDMNDTKYVFKKIHLLAAAKKGREDEYFAKTEVYSHWTDMFISKDISKGLKYTGEVPATADDNNYINIGEMMIAARNILCEKYCKKPEDRIPFDVYKNTLQPGLTYNEIRKRFVDDSLKYLISKWLINGTREKARTQIEKDISVRETVTYRKKLVDFIEESEKMLYKTYFKNHNREFPKGLFDDARRPYITFDQAEEIIRKKTVEYFDKNKIPYGLNKLMNRFNYISIICKKVGRIYIFSEIYKRQIDAAIAAGNGVDYFPRLKEGAFYRLDPRDLRNLFGNTAYFCIAHPNEEQIRKNTNLPVSAFEGIDISSLPQDVQDKINNKLKLYRTDHKDRLFSLDDEKSILEKAVDEAGSEYVAIRGDKFGLVKDEILLRSFKRFGKSYCFTLNGAEISRKMFFETEDGKNLHGENAWAHFDMYSRLGLAVNCNSALGDMHMRKSKDLQNIEEKYSRYNVGRKYFDDMTYACTKCSWLDLLQKGSFNREDQELEIRPLKQFFNKNYSPKKGTKEEKSM